MSYYKIRNMRTDKYSSGGQTPYWSKKGYSWSSEESVKEHVKSFLNNDFYDNSIIECIEMKEVIQAAIIIDDFYDEVKKSIAKELIIRRKDHEQDMDIIQKAMERRLAKK